LKGHARQGDTGSMTRNPMAEVERLIAPSIEAAGYDLVRVRMFAGRRPRLQVMAERKDRRRVTVDDCADISRLISPILDVADPIAGEYDLEVSSPGIDRPLVRADDYVRFAGFEAKVETEAAIEGRRRFRGRLRGVEDGSVVIECDGEPVALPVDDIRQASLVLTDELIAAAANEQNGLG
jgi:ribosome maturation factor RimP